MPRRRSWRSERAWVHLSTATRFPLARCFYR